MCGRYVSSEEAGIERAFLARSARLHSAFRAGQEAAANWSARGKAGEGGEFAGSGTMV